MKIDRAGVAFAILAMIAVPRLASAGTADEAFAKGETLLAEGDFDGALAAYASAARADRDNQEYLLHYALVRRVVQLRQQLEKEEDPAQWGYIGRALHSFYVSQGMYGEALALGRRMHARLNNASSAILLAETALAMNENAEAARTLRALDAAETTPAVQALLGVALARLGKLAEARQIAARAVLPDGAGPGTVYATARLHAVAGNSAESLRLLVRCFESAPPSLSEGYKAHAQRTPEFAGLASTAEFAEVLETVSKVPESKCSGGSKCAGCPMRGKCPSSGGR